MKVDESLFYKRAALYIRVSTDEQAREGYSLPAQRADLENFAKEHYMNVVDVYADEGLSARHNIRRRKQFQRMMNDVRAGLIDVILFIRLDRWFRSVSDYYEVQKVLDQHGVLWKCTREFYDTTTTNGRLNLNIKLAIAQNESDTTGDRIRFVFEDKVRKGEAITGAVPFGYKVEDHRVVIDPEKGPVAAEAFRRYVQTQNRHQTALYIQNTYGYKISLNVFGRMLANPMYKGQYRDNPDYCEPLVTPELWQQVQDTARRTSVKHAPSGRVYLFSTLVRCAECDHSMTALQVKKGKNAYNYYRCTNHFNHHQCPNAGNTQEYKIEAYLLEHIEKLLEDTIADYDIRQSAAKKSRTDTDAIRRKLSRLKDLYLNELITLDEYRKDYETYTRQLSEAEAPAELPKLNVPKLRHFLDSDFLSVYDDFTRSEKQALWRSVIDCIWVNREHEVVGVSFG